jgi:Prokaryotic membrane lipoprotein lipid attachment site
MKKILIATFAILLLSGCQYTERKRVSSETAAMTNVYAIKMEKGETTPAQDKEFIKAMRDVTYELDRSIRGKKKADETKKLSTALGNGTDPREVLKLK